MTFRTERFFTCELEGVMMKMTFMIGVIVSALLLGCAKQVPEPQTDYSCAPSEVTGPEVITTVSGLKLEVPKGFTARDTCEWVELLDNEFDVWVLEVTGADLGQAIDGAWAEVDPHFKAVVDKTFEPPPSEPFDGMLIRNYVVDANGLFAQAVALSKGDTIYVQLICCAIPVLEKRGAQISTFLMSMKVPGHKEEDLSSLSAGSVVGKTDAIDAFIEQTMKGTNTPGLSLALVEDGKVVYSKGYGVKKLGESALVNADTLMMIGSVTKSMTTLMMASLIQEGKLSWEAKVTDVYPEFALGDMELAKKLEVQHLVCACAGLPRKDMPLIFEYEGKRAQDVFKELATMKPTTGFKETFQYQNHMVAAGGYIAAMSVAPDAELCETYSKLMQERVFAPLGMIRTTLNMDKAVQDANHAIPHAFGLDGRHEAISLDHERFASAISPSGAVWSSASEMANYIIAEMNGGVSPDGVQVVDKANLEKRWEPQVTVSKDVYYGLGWIFHEEKGLRVVSHGGGTMGFATVVTFYPDMSRGVVMISNGTGGHIVEGFVGSLLKEIWFGTDEKVGEQVKFVLQAVEKQRADTVTRSSEPTKEFMKPLLGEHFHSELGKLIIEKEDSGYSMDVGTYRTGILKHERSDGKTTLICTDPPLAGVELILPATKGVVTLILNRGQEKYEFTK